jgi:hypothetical protein
MNIPTTTKIKAKTNKTAQSKTKNKIALNPNQWSMLFIPLTRHE